MNAKNSALGYLVLRLTLGVNLLLHGVVRMGSGRYALFIDSTAEQFAPAPLPTSLVRVAAALIPLAEALLGFLLVLGLLTRTALVLGSLLMLLLLSGMALLQQWAIVGLQMTYVLFYVILIYRLEDNRWSLDSFLAKKA